MNWGNQLVTLAANHAYMPVALERAKQRMKANREAGGSSKDEVSAHEYKIFAIDVLITEYQQSKHRLDFNLSQCWDKPAEYFTDLDQARLDLQQKVSA